MQHWARGYSNILQQAGLRLPLLSGYVDDGRQGSTVLRKGAKFDKDKKVFVIDDEQLKKDLENEEPDNVRMARICLPAMNSINKDLRFTTEAPEDFPRNRLPTLDFVIWMCRRNDHLKAKGLEPSPLSRTPRQASGQEVVIRGTHHAGLLLSRGVAVKPTSNESKYWKIARYFW